MPDSAPSYQRFFAELKRRKVFRVAAVYGVAAFVILQVADLIFEPLGLPEWTLTFLIVLIAFGFPIALILAWAFDLTPEGVKKTGDAAPGELTEIISAPAHKRWPSGVLALAGVIMLAVGGWLTLRSTVGDDAGSASAPMAEGTDGGQLASLTPTRDDGRRTIAVLPFDNMSGTEEAEPFTVGVHDDVLTQLSKIRALKVTSRTSVKEYRDTEKSIPEIASELGVETVLEGGVQRAGNMVRINVQLIDPATDEHLWAERYDAELTAENVFSIQAEIAKSVADALEAELSTAETRELDALPTRNLDALAAYHAGSREFERRATGSDDSIGVAELERAVALDPEFAEAWAKLAMMISWESRIRSDANLTRAREALAKAEALGPGSAEVEMGLGYYAYYAEDDFETALGHFRRAEQLRPSDGQVTAAIGYILRRQGDWEGAVPYQERAIELDPRNVNLYLGLLDTMDNLRRYRTIDVLVERALVIDPRNPAVVGWRVYSLPLLDGDYRRAASYGAELSPGLRIESRVANQLAVAVFAEGDTALASRLVDSPKPTAPNEKFGSAVMRGMISHAQGDREASRQVGDEVASLTADYPEVWTSTMSALASVLRYDTAAVRSFAALVLDEARSSADRMIAPQLQSMAAMALSMVGDQAHAADILLELATVPSEAPTVVGLEHLPWWDGLRASPEFPAVRAAFEAAEAEGARQDTEAGY